MKTIVIASHEAGPAINGHDGCHARFGNDGCCPGVETAAWLNSLGDDDELFGHINKTNGEVRANWLHGCHHIVAKAPAVANLAERKQTLRRELRVVTSKLAHALAQDALG